MFNVTSLSPFLQPPFLRATRGQRFIDWGEERNIGAEMLFDPLSAGGGVLPGGGALQVLFSSTFSAFSKGFDI
jgi:hypothetical protein